MFSGHDVISSGGGGEGGEIKWLSPDVGFTSDVFFSSAGSGHIAPHLMMGVKPEASDKLVTKHLCFVISLRREPSSFAARL